MASTHVLRGPELPELESALHREREARATRLAVFPRPIRRQRQIFLPATHHILVVQIYLSSSEM